MVRVSCIRRYSSYLLWGDKRRGSNFLRLDGPAGDKRWRPGGEYDDTLPRLRILRGWEKEDRID